MRREVVVCTVVALFLPLRAHASPGDCEVATYRTALSRGTVCTEGRAVVGPAVASTLTDPAAYPGDVELGLEALARMAAADDALDRGWRREFSKSVFRILRDRREIGGTDSPPTEAVYSVAEFEIRPGDATCGCVYVAGARSDAATCLRMGAAPRAPECEQRFEHDIALPETSAGVRTAVRYEVYLDLAFRGFDALNGPARAAAHHVIRESNRRWQRYRRGYFQLPWEMAFNGWLEREGTARICPDAMALDPCRLQWILFHPVAGLGVQLIGVGDASLGREAVATLAIEALGWVGYTSQFRSYYGGGILVGVDNLDFTDPRLGLMVHVTPYLHLGYVTSVRGETAGDGTIVLAGTFVGWARSLAGVE